ncbi:MAG: hypothetical protein H6502_00385 [Candidatus Woesearchaeota archaeon]|nr:MAG: hypothetical protein H6502_00385 [Candidatus Woesearchaeota archaeon]
MNLFGLAEELGKKMKWYDFSLLKLSVFFATLFLMTAWSGFRTLVLGIAWYWFLIITILLMIPLLKKMFS